MANKDNKSGNVSKLRDLATSVQQLSNDIYSDTYYTTPDNTQGLNNIRDGINKSLDNIMQRNMDINGRPNISNLYSRLIKSQEGSKFDDKSIEEIFQDQSLIDSMASYYSTNSYIKQYDAEIDLICKYMCKLEEAIEVKKDMVLCADQFNRDFLTIKNLSQVDDNDGFFNSEVNIMKEKYNLADILENSVYKAWKYGEDFLYIIPYDKAFDLIFNKREKLNNNTSYVTEEVSIELPDTSSKDDMNETFSFKLNFNSNNALVDAIKNIHEAASQLRGITESSINESTSLRFSDTVLEDAKKTGLDTNMISSSKISKHIIPDDTIPTEDDSRKINLSVDGTVTDTKKVKDEDLLKIPGCLVKRLERHKVIPIYIEDLCMGYYYIEIDDNSTDAETGSFGFQASLGSLQANNQQRAFGLGTMTRSDPLKDDSTLKQITAKIAEGINKKFINNNQNLYREIYMILKYDEKFNKNTKNINITFIPPDDMEHIYFRMDPKTHRGISLLDRAIIPAKIFISLTMSTAIGELTRGQDKRVYYVRQNVETNIAKTLLSAINQIKKGNFGVRNLENLMGVLNITGMYNDYFIPKSSNGESPIDFEVIEGQKFEPNMDLLEKFESYAIGTTDIPAELIDSRMGVEFATQLTMTNAKHMKSAYKDQSKVQNFGGKIITRIYNAEFGKTSQLALFLPPPLYITLTNNSQLVTNVSEYAEKVVAPAVKAAGGSDEEVAIATNAYIRRSLGTYIDFDMIDDIVKTAMLEAAKNKKSDNG